MCSWRTKKPRIDARLFSWRALHKPGVLLHLLPDDCKRLGVVVQFHLSAVLVVGFDLIAVVVDLELRDLVALRFDLRTGVTLLHPFCRGMNWTGHVHREHGARQSQRTCKYRSLKHIDSL